MKNPVRVLIVDDSPLVRSMLKKGLESFGDITVIAEASNPYEARDCISREKPDAVTLDIEMPKMNGIEFLRHLMSQCPIPVIMVSGISESGKKITMDALNFGAFDFIAKPQANQPGALTKMISELHQKIISASEIEPQRLVKKTTEYSILPHEPRQFRKSAVVAIGASTGGTEALKEIIPRLPKNFPPVLVTQHMPKGFTAILASRLNEISSVNVCEAVHGQVLTEGNVYIAPGGVQMGAVKISNEYRIVIEENATVNGHAPSVGYLFTSLITHPDVTAVILTGMGKDGSKEMLQLRQSGAYTIAQDKESCVVYGMPREAEALGGAAESISLNLIANTLIQRVKE